MVKKYDPAAIEPKWQKVWEENGLYKTTVNPAILKKYVLDMFPYPSGAVLHVGHMEGYVGTDVVCRYLRMKGYAVLHPMGWDAFGLPAENYAIKNGIPPDKSTHDNIKRFREQLKMLGLSYDWSREIDTSDPNYYRFTQWLFIQLFKHGYAYKKRAAANWCPSCETVLANEQVEGGKCERCGTAVIQKELDQWFLNIVAYADRLIEGLDRIEWPKSTKLMQKNWIGKKEGTLIRFKIQDLRFPPRRRAGKIQEIDVFTTRPDTILGATFVVLSPKHKLAGKVKSVINPATKQEIPVFTDEYVVEGVGTGAIMGVPAYDERDREFAIKNNLPIVEAPLTAEKFGEETVIYHLRDWLISRQRYWGPPTPMIFCGNCAGKGQSWFTSDEAKSYQNASNTLPKPSGPEPEEWAAGWYPVPDDSLPVKLPTDVDFRPTGASPIDRSISFQEGVVCPGCAGPAKREVDTMDGFVDSSWYFIRFLDPKNDKEIAGGKEMKRWMPVDCYVGGGHTVQHLLFARFFYKYLVDTGIVPASSGDEPFQRLVVQGWILGPDSRKMSKRWGNVITPDDVVAQYGADTMRMYEMFMAPFEADKPWNTGSVAGVHRFTNRLYSLIRLMIESQAKPRDNQQIASSLAKLIQKVGRDIENFRFNTAIAAMMSFINEIQEQKAILNPGQLKDFVRILAPFAPHLAEELYQMLLAGPVRLHPIPTSSSETAGARTGAPTPATRFESIHTQSWPTVDTSIVANDALTIAVSVNGKTRGVLNLGQNGDYSESKISALALENELVAKYVPSGKYKKVIYVPGKIINFVV